MYNDYRKLKERDMIEINTSDESPILKRNLYEFNGDQKLREDVLDIESLTEIKNKLSSEIDDIDALLVDLGVKLEAKIEEMNGKS